MPRWRVEMPRNPMGVRPLEIVEADGVAIGSGGALVFMDFGTIIRALAPGQWAHLMLLGDDAPDEAGDRYTAATQACR